MDKSEFRKFWDRLSRSTPVIGLFAHWAFYEKRIAAAQMNDAIYAQLNIHEEHKKAHGTNSDARERFAVFGEVFSHVIVVVIFAILWERSGQFPLYPLAWLVAFLMDIAGGNIGRFIFKVLQRKHA